MFPYYATFFISISLCALGERQLHRSRFWSCSLISLSVLCPVILAGARDFSIGLDISAYGNYVFETACNYSNFSRYMRTHREIESLYKVMAFLVSRFTDNAHWFYFVTALIICGCTMAGLLYYRGRGWCSLTLAWACFLFIIYGDTLNIMRQCIAVAIAFAAFPLFLEKKYLLYFIAQIAAIQFHVTGMIAFCLPLIYILMKIYRARWIYICAVIACFAAIQFYSPALAYLIRIHLLPQKFTRYLADGFAFALNPTILRLPFLLPILYFYDRFCGFDCYGNELRTTPAKRQKSQTENAGKKIHLNWGIRLRAAIEDSPKEENNVDRTLGMLVIFVLLLEICTVQLRSVLPTLYRISYYFSYYRFIAYARLTEILRRDNRTLMILALFAYLCVLWYYQNVLQGNNMIYPYIYAPGWFRRITYFSTGI